ncbi:NUDIX hydrolase [Pseudoalteromonas ruthenica]|uniref:NUDIX hydrolase n=1 Tax=Pseudoalteromonas ruthenica TaxID=151081 RepID=A0A0F4PJD9_9GAMM|nr:NUDIX domain-containing protein [Pseudoalteromonas ruthenica]KJY94386.1 NUDIX hydrolase [Pseudoalteromonas ruthenica]KJY94897.1 NUDIX hydrolase [Pseudoalteromonas ruthenica]TMO84137.1 NUDIX domain-containing protein [Pseudoalteromonas ruthenica]TMO90872.1 NUDIX domain-containing protein [Pseudoalteromonas ruthenica]TMO98684.1 NUDIX domain-containing protein [Pseudoalteromonas ruthenica]
MADSYDIRKYKNPLFTVDSVLFTVKDADLKVLLVKRASDPFTGQWALPGGFIDIDIDHDADMTALRKLKEKTNITPQYLEQLHTYSGVSRDPRGFSVTLVYFALVAEGNASAHVTTVDDVKWTSVGELQDLPVAFDHKYIVEQARQRLKQKALYSMVPVYCLPEYFTVGQFKSVIETILGKTVQRKTIIRRIEATDMLEKMDEKVRSGGRFAQLYRVKPGVDIVNFERNLST